MSAEDVLAEHRLITHESSLHGNTYSCSCKDTGECAMGITTNWIVHAGHQLDALKAAGYAVVELPKPTRVWSGRPAWDVLLDGEMESVYVGRTGGVILSGIETFEERDIPNLTAALLAAHAHAATDAAEDQS